MLADAQSLLQRFHISAGRAHQRQLSGSLGAVRAIGVFVHMHDALQVGNIFGGGNKIVGEGVSKSDCNSRDLKEGQYRCCYWYYKFGGIPTIKCLAISKFDYDDFDNYKKRFEDMEDSADDFSFDCNSSYIIISMFWILLLLF